MSHKYVKEEDTFSTSQNGVVPKPTAQEVSDNKYLRADGTWKNPPGGGGGGASEFADLDDVSFSNLQNGQIPKYNSTTQKWENANESGGTVTDVEVNGTSVVNQQGVAEITTPDELSDLSDIAFVSLQDHQPLRYNATSQKWVNGADSFPPLIYSDTEREVGVWTDGKPLYERTIVYSCADQSGVQVAETFSNGERPKVLVSAYFQNSSANDDIIPLMWVGQVFWDFAITNGGIYVERETNNVDWQSGVKFVCVLQYTKTTDTPGSGQWTTSGVPTHHYSTTEQVVGTWIDGKPLYEKTIAITSGFSTLFYYDPGISYIKRIINMDGMLCCGNTSHPLNTGTETAIGWDNSVMDVSGNSIRVHIGQDRLPYVTEVVIILRYTKTTD